MECIVQQSDLIVCLQSVLGIVERKTPIPILNNVLISVEKGIIRFSGTDLDVAAFSECPAEVTTVGTTTVSGKMLGEIVRELPSGSVHIKITENEKVEISAKNTRLKIHGTPSQEYPSLPGLSLEPQTKIPADVLLEMIQKTLYAAATDETRYNLCGVCFESAESDGPKIVRGKKSSTGKILRLVATDGHRLALINRPVDDIEINGRVIAPRKGLSELKKLLEQEVAKDIFFGVEEGFIVAKGRSTKLAIRLVDGEFPDYTRAFPQQEGIRLIVPAAEVAQAIKRVSLVVNDKNKMVKCDLTENSMLVSCSSPERGEASERLEVQYSGPAMSIGFNSRYLGDESTVHGHEGKLVMELTGETGPGRFYLESDESSYGIVMPIRLI